MSRKKYINSENLGERFKEFRKSMRLTLVELAKRIKVSNSYLSEVENNKKGLGQETLTRLREIFGLNLHWLLTGEGEMFEEPPIPNAISVKAIPVLGKVPAGYPDTVAENIIEYIYCPDAPPNAYAIVVKGESMSPTIRDGDYVIFIFDGNIMNGDIIIVNNEWGETMLKRYREKDGKIYLTSDNYEYPTITPNEHYKIIGKVVAVWRKIKIY